MFSPGTACWHRDCSQLHAVALPQALHHYSGLQGHHQRAADTAYRELRAALLSNVGRVHQETGFPWENYDDATGNGRGSHPFTGWTALFVLIAAEIYG